MAHFFEIVFLHHYMDITEASIAAGRKNKMRA